MPLVKSVIDLPSELLYTLGLDIYPSLATVSSQLFCTVKKNEDIWQNSQADFNKPAIPSHQCAGSTGRQHLRLLHYFCITGTHSDCISVAAPHRFSLLGA